MDTIGLARGTVSLRPYNSTWPSRFATEKAIIQKAVDIKSMNIQHVGSTSIPGMPAKPIIDIAVCVESLDMAEQWQDKLAGIGYWYKGKQPDMPDRRFFAKGPESKRTVYLHLVNKDEFGRLIKFREALINDPHVADEYKKLKQKLALTNANDRASYSKLKNNFIKMILDK